MLTNQLDRSYVYAVVFLLAAILLEARRHLIRQRQRALMFGDIDEAHRLRNLVNRTAPKLRHRFYQSNIAALEETSSKDWWKHMKNLMGAPSSNTNEMHGLANKCTEGNITQLYVLEYGLPAWHTSLPMYLSDNIETIQKRCLRTIFPGHSYGEARSISNLPTLFERRTKLCQSYFRKMLITS